MEITSNPHCAIESSVIELGDMGSKNKVTKVSDVVDRIIKLRGQIKELQTELDSLQGAPIQQNSPIPTSFDYKAAIMRLFDKPTTVMSIDSIVASISEKHGFVPNRTTVAIRVGYLADSANPKQLERLKEKRGYYRRIFSATSAPDVSSG